MNFHVYLGSLDHDYQEDVLPEYNSDCCCHGVRSREMIWRCAPVYAHVVTIGSHNVMQFQELGYCRMMTWTHEISKG